MFSTPFLSSGSTTTLTRVPSWKSPVPGFREVHTQIVGFGKMQQCRERDVDTLYLEEPMAPGTTHRPMYDDQGNYPWHQFETITPSIFMAVEMLPDGASPPQL